MLGTVYIYHVLKKSCSSGSYPSIVMERSGCMNLASNCDSVKILQDKIITRLSVVLAYLPQVLNAFIQISILTRVIFLRENKTHSYSLAINEKRICIKIDNLSLIFETP